MLSKLRNNYKLHWVDMVGILLFLAVLVGAVALLLRESRYVYVTLRLNINEEGTVFTSQYPEWYVTKLAEGLHEKNIFGRKTIEVVSVDGYQGSRYYSEAFVVLKVQSTYSSRKKTYSYDGKDLLIGNVDSFRVANFLINGTIFDVSEELTEHPKSKIIVKGFVEPSLNGDYYRRFGLDSTYGVQNYFEEAITPEVEVMSQDGEVVFKILELEKKPGEREFLSGNQVVRAVDPYRTQIFVTAEVVADKIGTGYFYDKVYSLHVGSLVNFKTHEVPFFLTITDVEIPEGEQE